MPDISTETLNSWFTTLWDANTAVPFIEDENCNITGYGHRDKELFAEQVNAYDTLCNGEPDAEAEQWTADDIGHRWAVMDGNEERFWVRLDGEPVTADTPGAFPITTLWGQR